MRLADLFPLLGFVIPTLVIGYGLVTVEHSLRQENSHRLRPSRGSISPLTLCASRQALAGS
jgi:hypothetical protein